MRLERHVVDGIAVVGPAETVEIGLANSDQFKDALLGLLVETDRHVILDASRINFFDSAGMSCLLSIQKRLKERRGGLVLCCLNRSINEVFRMVGFDVVFTTTPNVEQAVKAVRG